MGRRGRLPSEVSDPARIAEVRATRLLDGAPDPAIDRLTGLAARLVHAPVARVTLVDDLRSVATSAAAPPGTGLDTREHPVEDSLCQHVVTSGDQLLVEDLSADARTCASPLASQPGAVAWAGTPIRSLEGRVLGALSVIDSTPRRWTATEAEVLATLAQAVASEIALRVATEREREARDAADFRAALLRASLESTLDGVLVVSPDGTMISSNARFATVWPIPDEVTATGSDAAALQSVLDKLVDPEGFLRRVRDLYANPRPARDELRLLDGRVLDRYGTPLVGEDGTYYGYAWYVRDVSNERAAREAVEASESRYRSLVQALTSAVWSASPTGELTSDMSAWRAVTGQTREQLLGRGWLLGVHPDDREDVERAWQEAVGSGGTYETEYRIRPLAGTPVEVEAGTRVLDVRGVPIRRADAVVEWVGVFVDVTDLRTAEAARERLAAMAAAAADRTRALQQVTAALSGAVTMADVLAVILEQGQAGLGATGSGVALRDGDRVRYQVLNGYSPDVKAAWAEFALDISSPVTHVLRSGEPMFLESRDELLRIFDNPAMRSFIDATGESAFARLPLRTSSAVVGVLTFGFADERRFSEEEREFLLALAGQCAQALERAQLYERERHTALLLQRSLLPDALPSVPDTRLAARYQPAVHEVEVGGDWYDALVLPDGRLVVALGDVMGKGVRAASVMGQVRNALRGLVHADPSPSAVLGWLDAVVAQLGDDEELVTLAYGVLDPTDGTFAWGCAGHPTPLLLTDGEATYVDGGESLPLGLGGDRPSGLLRLDEGHALLLFSDGLVESRARPLVDGLRQLRSTAASLLGDSGGLDPDAACDALVDRLVVRRDDDVTLLLLRRELARAGGVEPTSRSASLLLPGKVSSASTARRFVAAQLHEWSLGDAADSALLCVSEAVTNAVVHASSEAELSLHHANDVLRVEVRDSGPSLMPLAPRAPHLDDTHGRGLMLIEAVADAWGVGEEPGGKVVWFEVTTG